MFFRLFGAIIAPLFFSTAHASSPDNYYYTGQDIQICHPPNLIDHRSEIPGNPYFLKYTSGDSTMTYITIVIWGDDIPQLEIDPMRYFSTGNSCLEGKVSDFRGQKQLIIRNSSQLVVNKK